MAATRTNATIYGAGRNVGLDLLRLAAILLVIGRHFQPPPPIPPI